ncbi:MAG: NnrS family protein [Albidovulum sp.]
MTGGRPGQGRDGLMCPGPEIHRHRSWRFGQIWEAPHRPLFLAAFLWALGTVAWWPLGNALGLPSPPFEPAVLWHIHELLFGFAAAAVGGYVLTALPGWTSREPVQGATLKCLVLLWVAARIATAFANSVPLPALIFANGGYFVLLAGILCHQSLSSQAYGKVGYGIAVLFLGSGELLYLTAALTGRPWVSLTIAHVSVIGFALLAVTIAGRAIPAFTRNWFYRTGRTDIKIDPAPRLRLLAQGLLVVAIISRLAGWFDLLHGALICAALVLFWIMRGWKTMAALSNPLLAALNLAFLWLPIGLGMIGALGFLPALYPVGDALHAITIGAMSGLIMAIAGRAASHRDGGDMTAGPGFMSGIMMVWLATWFRLIVPLFPFYGSGVLTVSAILWCVGWAIFIAGFLPAVFGPVIRPVLSGKKYLTADSPEYREKRSFS